MPSKEHELWVQKIKKGLEKTYENLIEFKKMKKSTLVVMEKGEIVEISPDDLPPTIKIL